MKKLLFYCWGVDISSFTEGQNFLSPDRIATKVEMLRLRYKWKSTISSISSEHIDQNHIYFLTETVSV